MDESEREQIKAAMSIGRAAQRVGRSHATVGREVQAMMAPIRAAREALVRDTGVALARPTPSSSAVEVLREQQLAQRSKAHAVDDWRRQIAEATQQSARDNRTMAEAITMLAAATTDAAAREQRMFRWAQAGVILAAVAAVVGVLALFVS